MACPQVLILPPFVLFCHICYFAGQNLNSQSLEDPQVGYTLQKYSLGKYTLENTLEEHCCRDTFSSTDASIYPRSITASLHPWLVSPHHSNQMSQRSRVSVDPLLRSRDADRMEIWPKIKKGQNRWVISSLLLMRFMRI